MSAHLLDSMRELLSRINDGIHVRVLWRKPERPPDVTARRAARRGGLP